MRDDLKTGVLVTRLHGTEIPVLCVPRLCIIQSTSRVETLLVGVPCVHSCCLFYAAQVTRRPRWLLAVLRARSRSYRKQTRKPPQRRAEEWTTACHMRRTAGPQAARFRIRSATASAKMHTQSLAPGPRSRSSSEAGTCAARFTDDLACSKLFSLVGNRFLHRTAAMCSFDR
jgi:hypothetical protein